MTLPAHWRETQPRSNRPGTWRFQVRNPGRFRIDTIRTVPLEGVKGVKLIAGKLQKGDQELEQHRPDAMVPQAVIYDKREWPEFRDALAWNGSHFSRIGNPPRKRRRPNQPGGHFKPGDRVALHAATSEWMQGDRYGAVVRLGRAKVELDRATGATVSFRPVYVKLDRSGRTKRFHPDNLFLENPGNEAEHDRLNYEAEAAGDRFIAAMNAHRPKLPGKSEAGDARVLARMKGPVGDAYRDMRAAEQRLHAYGRGLLGNPPPERLEAFRAEALAAVARLATTETELQTLFVQALELIDRGAPVPEWIRTQARGLQLEKLARLEDVKRAVERHGAALGEFSVPKGRRGNPARIVAGTDAESMYREFHGGRAPTGYRRQRVPDLSQLVTLGRVLSIDYQLEPQVARGARNTPYTHAFDRGSTLLTDPTGRVLVIMGNVKVSRSPRGRFGYIRAASGVR